MFRFWHIPGTCNLTIVNDYCWKKTVTSDSFWKWLSLETFFLMYIIESGKGFKIFNNFILNHQMQSNRCKKNIVFRKNYEFWNMWSLLQQNETIFGYYTEKCLQGSNSNNSTKVLFIKKWGLLFESRTKKGKK